jgi:hypothetical protein
VWIAVSWKIKSNSIPGLIQRDRESMRKLLLTLALVLAPESLRCSTTCGRSCGRRRPPDLPPQLPPDQTKRRGVNKDRRAVSASSCSMK